MVQLLHEGPPVITDRQRQVIELIADGYSRDRSRQALPFAYAPRAWVEAAGLEPATWRLSGARCEPAAPAEALGRHVSTALFRPSSSLLGYSANALPARFLPRGLRGS